MSTDFMSAEAVWQGDFKFEGTTGSGHTVPMDASIEVGGSDTAPRPLELLLVGNAGCTGMDVVSILKKMRQPITGYKVRIRGDRAEEHPRVFTHIVIEHILQGDLDDDKVAHAVELSDSKYCSAGAMLAAVAQVEVKWTIERP